MSFDAARAAQLIDDAQKALTELQGMLAMAGPLTPLPPPAVASGTDAVDLSTATLMQSGADASSWPIGARITSIVIPASPPSGTDDGTRNWDLKIDFTKRDGPDRWPFVVSPEHRASDPGDGFLQFTLWVGCCIAGKWYFAACIHCISRSASDHYVPTGPTLLPGQLPQQWYNRSSAPLVGYQPRPNETVAWFLTAGCQRMGDVSLVQERTNVVKTPFAPGTYRFP